MAAITESVEIARSPEDVFAYLDDLTRHAEWQDQLESVRVQTDGATQVGTRALETRRMGRRTVTATYEITEHDPPKVFAFRALDGPVRPVGRGRIEPAGDGRSRVTIDLDFEGHGIGKLLVPLARRQAAKQVPKDQQRLKEKLESGVS